MWRPKNWKNINPEYGEVTTNDYLYAISVSFEAGADAMLEYLLSQKHDDWLGTEEGESYSGRWRFIPKENDEEKD